MSGIRHIGRQPFIFQDRNEYQTCKKDESTCALINDGDDIMIQFINEACGSALLCDSDFTSGAGDLITNGGFSGSASGWTFAGVRWAFNAANYMDYSSLGPVETLSQTIAAGLVNGRCYTLQFTILNYSSGSVTPSVGGTAGTAVSADGTYYQKIVAGAGTTIVFTPSGAGSFSLSGVILSDMGSCWCPDNGYMQHSTEGNYMCHIPGSQTILSQVGVTPNIDNGKLYKVSLTITGWTTGSVHAIVGTAAASIDFEGNGNFTDYVIADADDLFSLVFSSDFDGCITDVLVYLMNTDHAFSVVNIDETAVQDMSGFAQYVDNRIILSFNTSDFSFSHGCYKMVAIDGCDTSEDFSNCFNWQTEHVGTRQVIAIDRESTDPSSRYSYGFLWFGTTFYLIQRVNLNFRKPTYNTKSVTDRFSTGERFRSYAEKSKTWELAISDLDETKHDCMELQWGCKLVSIDGVYYFTRDEEYTPLYDDGGFKELTDVKINVTLREDVIFADNCNR